MIVISEQYMHNSTVYCSNVLTEDVAAVQRTEDAVVFFSIHDADLWLDAACGQPVRSAQSAAGLSMIADRLDGRSSQ